MKEIYEQSGRKTVMTTSSGTEEVSRTNGYVLAGAGQIAGNVPLRGERTPLTKPSPREGTGKAIGSIVWVVTALLFITSAPAAESVNPATPGTAESSSNASSPRAADSSNSSSSRPAFANFKILSATNIFNTKRSAIYKPSQITNVRPRTTEYVALVGVMTYEKGPFAFFEGSSSEYQKVLKTDESIAGFKLKAIEQGAVKLASPTNELELKVGMQLTRQDGGPWQMGIRPENLDTSGFRTAAMTWKAQPAVPRTERDSQPQGDGPPQFPGGFQGFPDAIIQAFQNGPPGASPGGVVIQTSRDQNGESTSAVIVPAPPGGDAATGDVLQRLIRRRQEQQGNQ